MGDGKGREDGRGTSEILLSKSKLMYRPDYMFRVPCSVL